jgi:hypothetical protein
MSKLIRRQLLLAAAAVLLGYSAVAQDMAADITVIGGGSNSVKVEGRFLSSAKRADKRALFLNDDAASVSGLADRVTNIRLFANGENVAYRKISAGTFMSEREFDSWAYDIDISEGDRRNGIAHISRLNSGYGVLMLDDLLPSTGQKSSASVRFVLTDGQKVLAAVKANHSGIFEVPDVENAVFVIGNDWRFIGSPGTEPTIAVRGKWHFSDEELAAFTTEVFRYYTKLFGGSPGGEKLVVISPFFLQNGYGSWEADTRGRTVNILLSDTAFATQSKQRLHEILRHEIFHLWLPNSVSLNGNYAWFYEGAALYASLKAAVLLNRIRFDDMLDTLSRAYRIETSASEPLSLIAMSARSWSGSSSRLYARGMITAFLCDVEMLNASGGRRSFEKLLRDIYQDHKEGGPARDATDAILSLMGQYAELRPVISSYVSGGERLNWLSTIAKAGLEENGGKLTVSGRLNGKQKARLDELGYNAWRRVTTTRQ